MLIEIRCAEFKANGKLRPAIKFNPGLNTVLGDQVGSNSIGKSTFLMIIDFVFGGNDYIKKSKDIQQHVGKHVIQFAFMFKNQMYYYSRDTILHNRVNECDSEYNIISKITLEDFKKDLLNGYTVSLPSMSFRDVIARYFRIYKRENLDENRPLRSFSQEKEEASIASLIKLFNMDTDIKELRENVEIAKEKSDVYKKSMQYNFIYNVNAKQSKENECEIRKLNSQLEKVLDRKTKEEQMFWKGTTSEDVKQLFTIKKELTSLRQQKSRLETKLARIQNNLENSKTELQNDFSELRAFFPFVDIKKIQEIETFHSKLRSVLEKEFRDEQQKTKILLNQIERSIIEHQASIDNEAVVVINKISRKTLDEYHEIKHQIEQLELQNSTYETQQKLKDTVKIVKDQLKESQAGKLRELQSLITKEMANLNNFIYDGIKKAPILTLESGKKYIFETPDDTGTGTSYKGLVIFDLSILALTSLPALVHDSVVLKQIADAPLEKILELYQNNGKQVFIALDKVNSYSQRAQKILEQSAILRLGDNGNELFGRSWNTKEEDTRTNL